MGRIRTYIKASSFEVRNRRGSRLKESRAQAGNAHDSKKGMRTLSQPGGDRRAPLRRRRLAKDLVLHILTACGLRPAEILVLRMEDFDGTKLRIDEALKDREKGEARIGRPRPRRAIALSRCRRISRARSQPGLQRIPSAPILERFCSKPQRNAVQRRELLEALPEAVSGEGGDTRSYSSDISAHLFHAYSGLRQRRGPTRPPPPHQPPNDTEALHESDPREPARCGCGSRREHRRRGERVQTTQVERSLEGSVDRQQRAESRFKACRVD